MVGIDLTNLDQDRFSFGKNWSNFLKVVSEERVALAERSLLGLLGVTSLGGLRFLDIGSGSGLFSLAARRLGAEVVSFDYDMDSVRCAEVLKARYRPDDSGWRIGQGSVLDREFMQALGQFDIVYSWGVLHHTGAMWPAIDLAATRVAPGGLFAIALYNDQDGPSRRWHRIKRAYNRLPNALKLPYVLAIISPYELKSFLLHLLKGDPLGSIRAWTHYSSLSGRGMSKWHDWVDWIGGYPFEVATPDLVLERMRPQGFDLERLITRMGGLGCNEYVFRKRTGV